jgi:ubiquinone/menaquinone biosynthesis C-methylase UbiE
LALNLSLTANEPMMTLSGIDGAGLSSFLDVLRCPRSGERLIVKGRTLTTLDGCHRYRLSGTGIIMFAEDFVSPEAEAQRQHYNKVAATYTANLEYRHTREYLACLNRIMLDAVGQGELGTVAELCCGRGEGLKLFGGRASKYIGIDVSESMLQCALPQHNYSSTIWLQADVIRLPLATESVDTVLVLGGIHHVPQRSRFFVEVARILKPGGRLFYREPASDFFLWRALRAIIYRLSPMLHHDTERALRYEETVPLLEEAGLRSLEYRTHGLLGFCLFMNSDVLLFNRLFRFVPGIGPITRASARLDEAILRLPGLGRAGLQVVGIAEKPARSK